MFTITSYKSTREELTLMNSKLEPDLLFNIISFLSVFSWHELSINGVIKISFSNSSLIFFSQNMKGHDIMVPMKLYHQTDDLTKSNSILLVIYQQVLLRSPFSWKEISCAVKWAKRTDTAKHNLAWGNTHTVDLVLLIPVACFSHLTSVSPG